MLKTEVKCLYAEVMSLKEAIEEAIVKGQKSVTLLEDVPELDMASDEESEVASANPGCGVVGSVDDF